MINPGSLLGRDVFVAAIVGVKVGSGNKVNVAVGALVFGTDVGTNSVTTGVLALQDEMSRPKTLNKNNNDFNVLTILSLNL